MNILRFTGSGIRKTNYFLYLSGGVFIAYACVVTLIDVTGRYFRHPLPGAGEMSQLVLLAMVFLTIAHTQAEKGHVSIELLFTRLPRRGQEIVDLIMSLLGLIMAAVLAWSAVIYALNSKAGNVTTDMIKIPVYPFQLLMFIGGFCLFCQFILDLLDGFHRIGGHRRGNTQ
ncbi:TRAP transporter small permease [Chloroflexota bacterium]